MWNYAAQVPNNKRDSNVKLRLADGRVFHAHRLALEVHSTAAYLIVAINLVALSSLRLYLIMSPLVNIAVSKEKGCASCFGSYLFVHRHHHLSSLVG